MNKNRSLSEKITEWVFILLLISIPVLLIANSGGTRRAIRGIKEPVQTEASGSDVKNINGYNVTITYKYAYSIEALVLRTKNYGGNTLSSKLAPVDAALAWGDVAAYNDRINFHWNQKNRWYFWRVNSYDELFPVGDSYDVSLQSANNHLIPADEKAEKKVKFIKKGDHIRITGYLVDIYAATTDGKWFTWNSSTTREDTGDGSCEVIYVKDVEWLK